MTNVRVDQGSSHVTVAKLRDVDLLRGSPDLGEKGLRVINGLVCIWFNWVVKTCWEKSGAIC